MAHGFKSGGRKKGTPNRVNEEIQAKAAASGMLPLDYMLKVMRDEKASDERRDAAASAAAPYLHRKLVPIGGEGAVRLTSDGDLNRAFSLEFVLPSKHAD